jgi:hypothetical protein
LGYSTYDHLVHFLFIWYIWSSFGIRKIWQPCERREINFSFQILIFLNFFFCVFFFFAVFSGGQEFVAKIRLSFQTGSVM